MNKKKRSVRSKFQKWLKQMIMDKYVELFDCNDTLEIKIKEKNLKNGKTIKLLARNQKMESMIIETVKKITKDPLSNDYEGIIYFVFSLESEKILLNYIGITKKMGRNEKKINFNLDNIESDRNFFARWGDDTARHIGGLSNALFENSTIIEKKYRKWAESLFTIEKDKIFLKKRIYFFALPWNKLKTDYLNRKLSIEEVEYNIIQEIGTEINSVSKKNKNKNKISIK